MTREEQLEKEIAEKQKELEALRKKQGLRDKVIKPLSEYSIEEKCAWFDGCYRDAENTLYKKEAGEYYKDEDDAQYLWEDMMTLIARDREQFWKYFNSL